MSVKMKLYTKTGDSGTTSLYNGDRVAKHSMRMQCIGTVDELNAHIGLLATSNLDYRSDLQQIMSTLFDIGSVIATPSDTSTASKLKRVATDFEPLVVWLEGKIDEMDSVLPSLNNFILPTGSTYAVSQSHVCRAVCRRAERDVCAIILNSCELDSVKKYLNRLSDYFFQLARFITWRCDDEDVIYKKPKN